MKGRRGTKGNPFEVKDCVRTRYFRGAAPEKERKGVVVEVSEWAGAMAVSGRKHLRYRVRWRDKKTGKLQPADCVSSYDWLTARALEADT